MKHLVILKQPYFNMILSGEKTIESRWSVHKIAPYNKVKIGDILYLKETGKNVYYKAICSDVKFFEITHEVINMIKEKYGDGIKMRDYSDCYNKKYCSLIWISNIEKIEEMKVKRSNGAGWIIMD